MHVWKTFKHGGITLEHGQFQVRETVHVCAKGCIQPGVEGKPDRALIKRQDEVAQLLMPRSTMGYDLMVFVGRQRFVHYRQREEVRAVLESRYDITLSSGETSELARRFLVYLEALHQSKAPKLREALEQDGGWPLHIDATGEDGRGTLFVAYAGWRQWALGAWKIPTERSDAILPKMRDVAGLFGPPCAIMRDLGKAVIEASLAFVKDYEEPIPIFGCHLHFLKDIGKDLLRPSHDELRDLFRRFKILPRLRAEVRCLGRALGTDIEKARSSVASWLAGGEGDDERFEMPEDQAGLAVVRALGQWVLDYPHDGTDAGFPFDCPNLDLYRRCLRACRAIESLLCKPSNDEHIYLALERMHRIVVCVRSELPFHRPASILETRATLFAELRDAMRLKVKRPAGQPDAQDSLQQQALLRDVKAAVATLRASLLKRRPRCGSAKNTREAMGVILDHLDRHGSSLWGHVLALPPEAGGGVQAVERTNVILESFFHTLKHNERRRSGRKVLTQDFENLPAAAILASNLTRPDYVAIVCGTLDNLPLEFAKLDAGDRRSALPVRLRAAAAKPDKDETDIVSSSLPKSDRDLVRTDAMAERVLAEARSRAPRHPVRGHLEAFLAAANR